MRETGTQGSGEESGARLPMFGRTGLLALLAVTLAGVWFKQGGLAALGGTLLCCVGLCLGWSKVSLNRVSFNRRLSQERAFPGEKVELSLALENRKPLPLAWLEAEERLDRGLEAEGAENGQGWGLGQACLRVAAPFPWYRRATWTFQLTCRRRGGYRLGPVRLSSGDIFGLFPRTELEPATARLIVYPRLYALNGLSLPSRQPLGEARAEVRLFEDPTRIAGLRPYTPGSPLNRIHWKASAKRGALQVKVYEPTSTIKTILLLDASGFQGLAAPSGEVHFEVAVSLVASLARRLLDEGHQVGLWVNAVPGEDQGLVNISPGAGPGQLALILEKLALIGPKAEESFLRLMDSLETQLPWGATLVFVGAYLDPACQARLAGLMERGFKTTAFQVGLRPLPQGPVPCRRVLNPEGPEAG